MATAIASPPSTAPDLNPPPSDQSRKRGRPKKLLSDLSPTTKKNRTRPAKKTEPVTKPVTNGPVYIVSQAEQINSGLLQNLPGAVAIVLPKSLLTEKAAKSPVLILPRGIQSFIDVSDGDKKKKKKEGKEKRMRGRPRKKDVLLKEKREENVGSKGGWKIRDLLGDGKKDGILEVKKRSVGRPRKNNAMD